MPQQPLASHAGVSSPDCSLYSTICMPLGPTNIKTFPFPRSSPCKLIASQDTGSAENDLVPSDTNSGDTSAQPSSETSTPAADRGDRTASPKTAAQYDAARGSFDNNTGESFPPAAPSNDNAGSTSSPSTSAAAVTPPLSGSTSSIDGFSESGVRDQARRSVSV